MIAPQSFPTARIVSAPGLAPLSIFGWQEIRKSDVSFVENHFSALDPPDLVPGSLLS
jgi:hypothetical protein